MMNPEPSKPDITQYVKGKVIYVLALVALVQTIYPITANNIQWTVYVYQILYASLMVTGIILARDNPFYSRLLIILGIIWLISGITYAYNSTATWASLLAYGAIAPFQATVINVLLRFIFVAKTVTRDVIYAAIAIYLLIGAFFVPVYGIIETVTFDIMDSHAFTDNTIGPDEIFPWQNFIYYSYSTLTTVGYGDILPVTMLARSVASIEAIIGVLYITIVMARLVGLYVTQDIEEELSGSQ